MRVSHRIITVIFCLLAAIVSLASLNGCTGLQVQDKEVLIKVAIHAAASNFGYWVATEQPDLYGHVKGSYYLLKSGQVPPEDVAEVLKEIAAKKPLLAMNMANCLRAMGAIFAENGVFTDKIPEAYWDEAAIGFNTGFAMGGGVIKDE